MQPDAVQLTGVTHEEDASAEIARLLSDKLGEAENFTLDINYVAPPEPVVRQIVERQATPRR